MEYIPGNYTQAQLKKAIDEVEIALTDRYLTDGAITDAAEKKKWRELIQENSFGRQTVLYDDLSYPSVMCKVPLFREVDVLAGAKAYPHPMFIVNGVVKPMLNLSKYQNITVGTGAAMRALSLKGVDPKVDTITHDVAVTACKQKGVGWHCMTNAESSGMALLSKARGFMPRGNNNYGADYAIASEKGVPSHTYSGTTIGRVLTGSGPSSWTSDGTPFGIYDLNGNIYEWTPGMRLNEGEIQIIPDNDAADNTKDLSATSAAWRALLQDGSLVHTKWVATTAYALNTYIVVAGIVYKATTGGNSGSTAPTWPTATPGETVTDGMVVWTSVADLTMKYDFVTAPANGGAFQINTVISQANPNAYYGSKTFEALAAAAGVTVPNLMKLLALAPIDTSHGSDNMYMNNTGERCALRGGYWDITSSAGVFYLGLDGHRSIANGNVGFRSAFVA